MLFAVPLVAAVTAFLSYRFFEQWTARSWLPAGLRSLGWASLALLLVNASGPAAPASIRPLVLLDGSISMQAAGGKWAEARALAQSLGEVRVIGSEPGDTTPRGGHSRFEPLVRAAEASGRPVTLVTDGEVEDGTAILGGTAIPEIRVLRREPIGDLALTRVEGSRRITQTDTFRLELEIAALQMPAALGRRIGLTVREGNRIWLRGTAVIDSGNRAHARLAGPIPPVAAGTHVLRIGIAEAGDREPRTDSRLWVVQLMPTPGVVLLASPPSWESRFLIANLRDVAQVPVRGYLETEPGSWRRAGDLQPAAATEVAAAARNADLLVVLGTEPSLTRGSRARARWSWPSLAPIGGDWYLLPGGPSPLSGALSGLPVDSFPPGTAVADLAPRPSDWVGLSAQLGRRGAARPVVFGHDSSGLRRVMTTVEGLWRWAFRGGSSEQGYRALVAATASWLLGATDTTTGKARLEREVVAQGVPATFTWSAGGNPVPLAIEWTGDPASRRDTLVFDGNGRARIRLPPGVWRYRLGGGGEGTLAVEEFSEELLPHPVTLSDRSRPIGSSRSRQPVRRWLWLFGLTVAAFAGEWAARRRLGLR